MIMDRAAGRPLLSGLDGIAVIAQGRSLLRQIPDSLAATMAKLHAVDPEPVHHQLDGHVGASVGSLLEAQRQMASSYGRADLTEVAEWLINRAPFSAPDVICHGDLHPFNLLIDGEQITVLDWSTSLVGPRAHDVAFTSLLLAEPPLAAPRALRPVVHLLGRRMARRFFRSYQHYSGATPSSEEIQWHQALIRLRAIVEVAGWANEGHVQPHAGHPWLTLEPAFAARLTAATGVQVRAHANSEEAK